MVEVDESKIKEAENAIRDLINWIEVWNLEEVEGGVKKIEDVTVDELKTKLSDIAEKVSGMTVI
ncbi:hypothetical protein KY342_06720 [Candidatus Woesearchaeota archaeon]|nr:hypothetical protein [Candidatus Woesearchaeota archaeon]